MITGGNKGYGRTSIHTTFDLSIPFSLPQNGLTITPANTPEDHSTEQRVDTFAEMICRAHDSGIRAAALLVLMAALENAEDPKSLANNAKHYAFTRCGELNACGMVDAQIAVLENELLTHNSHLS